MKVIKLSAIKSHELGRLLLQTENLEVAFFHEMNQVVLPGQEYAICPDRIQVPVKGVEECPACVLLS